MTSPWKQIPRSNVVNDDVIKEESVYQAKEIAQALRVSTVTIARAIRTGKLKAFRVGGQWRILGSEVSRYIKTGTSEAIGHANKDGE
jgi:excisionase family DNA binding protein